MAALGREFHRVRDQVQHHLLQAAIVGLDLGQVGRVDQQVEPRLLDLAAHQPGGVVDHLLQRHGS
jgi:hypothetical protein